jgi:phage shock protein PspC (stress-responsive transcriptional regulator)
MKKTINVNLNGRVFTMDEDAYQLLDNYLSNLRIYFRKEEGSAEIIADFEARIEELFSEKIRLGYQVINISQVEEVIARVGKPDDFSEEDSGKEETQTCSPDEKTVKKKFFRNPENKIIGGVCSGIGAYFEWDVLAIRIVFIILILVTSLWIIPVYLLAWIFFPEAKTTAQKLQMRGKPITVENIGKMVADDSENFDQKEKSGCLGSFIEFIGKTLKGCFFGLGCLLAFPALLVIGVIFLLAITLPFGIGGEIPGILPWYWQGSIPFLTVTNPIPTSISLIILLLIPFVALIYGIISYFAKLKPLNAWIKWTSFSIWIIALILFLCSGFEVNWKYISGRHSIEGNGILSEKTDTIAPIDHILLENGIVAHLQIEQIPDNYATLLLSGDENLIENIHYDVNNGKLRLFTDNYFYLSRNNNLIIRIQTPSLKKIEPGISGKTNINKTFICNELELELSGAGYFQADSLTVQTLKVDLEGSAFVKIAGYARNVKFDLDGATKVDAWDLLSDTVDAEVNGVGSIRCNPTEYLKGEVNGVGNIKYKNEPKRRNVRVFGVGNVGLE